MRFLLYIFPLLLPLVLGQAAEIECPDDNLTTYLLALLDKLYDNGLTHFEQLLAKLSESDSGYALLESWHSDETFTLFVPTDSAFQQANVLPPFDDQTEQTITDLVAYHAVNGQWTADKIPEGNEKGIGETQMVMKEHMNSTVESTAHQAMVMQRGDNGAISLRLATGNATTWGWQIDTANSVLYNIIIIPVDTVSLPSLLVSVPLLTYSRLCLSLRN